jgi:hypothetical protein
MALPVGLFVYSFGFNSSDPWAFGLCVDMGFAHLFYIMFYCEF